MLYWMPGYDIQLDNAWVPIKDKLHALSNNSKLHDVCIIDGGRHQ